MPKQYKLARASGGIGVAGVHREKGVCVYIYNDIYNYIYLGQWGGYHK